MILIIKCTSLFCCRVDIGEKRFIKIVPDWWPDSFLRPYPSPSSSCHGRIPDSIRRRRIGSRRTRWIFATGLDIKDKLIADIFPMLTRLTF
jgi:hypothetical protein